MKQRTLKSEFSVSGKGLHTGVHITATFKPAPVNFGYKIKRIECHVVMSLSLSNEVIN